MPVRQQGGIVCVKKKGGGGWLLFLTSAPEQGRTQLRSQSPPTNSSQCEGDNSLMITLTATERTLLWKQCVSGDNKPRLSMNMDQHGSCSTPFLCGLWFLCLNPTYIQLHSKKASKNSTNDPPRWLLSSEFSRQVAWSLFVPYWKTFSRAQKSVHVRVSYLNEVSRRLLNRWPFPSTAKHLAEIKEQPSLISAFK